MYFADSNVESYARQSARSSPAAADAAAPAAIAAKPDVIVSVIATAIVVRTLDPMIVFPRRTAATNGSACSMLKRCA
jgi:hypothetical protein